MKRPVLVVVIVLFFLLICFSNQTAAIPYECTLLEMPGTTWTRAHDINEAGQVAVQASTPSGELAAIWEGETTTVLPLPQGIVAAAGFDINDSGQVAGTASDGSAAYTIRWDTAGSPTSSILGQVNWGQVHSINSIGQVVGRNGTQPVRWDGATIVDLQCTGPGEVCDINDNGQSVGWMTASDRVPVRWDDLSPVILPLPVGEQYGSSFAYAINNAGQIAGRLQHDPIRWDQDVPTMLDLLPGTYLGSDNSTVSDINNAGQVVGWLVESQTGNFKPVIWNDTTPSALPLPDGISRGYALGLNDLGQVVGYVDILTEGICYAARWDPVTTPIPIPSSIWLFVSLLIGLVGFRRQLKMK